MGQTEKAKRICPGLKDLSSQQPPSVWLPAIVCFDGRTGEQGLAGSGPVTTPPLAVPSPGSRVVIRDEEWLVLRTDPTSDGGFLLTCDGVSELVRGRSALFLTELEEDIEVLDPANTELVADDKPDLQRRLPVPRKPPPPQHRRTTNRSISAIAA